MTDIFYVIEFIATNIWQVWPLFLASIILSVLIRALKLDGVIRRAFNANVGLAIILATFVGAFSPFCSCTVVPVIAGLLLSGVPLAPIMSFWIASPTMDPEIFTLSVGVLGWPLALTRLVATLVLSLAAGYMTLALTHFSSLSWSLIRRRPQLKLATNPGITTSLSLPMITSRSDPLQGVSSGPSTAQDRGPGTPHNGINGAHWRHQLSMSFRQIEWPEFGRQVGRQSWLIGRWLLLAFILEALITLYVPQESIARILGDDNPFAVPLAALIGIPLYLNNFGALPIVSGLLEQGMQPGAAIAFLIAGPVTTVPAMTAVYGLVQKRIFILYLSIGLLGAMAMGLVTNILL